jgi:hypothetical protein
VARGFYNIDKPRGGSEIAMDWPLIGALTGVTALAGAVGTGGYLMLHAAPATVKAAPPPPVLLVAPRSVGIDTGQVYLASVPAAPRYTIPELHLAPVAPPLVDVPRVDTQTAPPRPPADDYTNALPYRAERKRPASRKPVEHAVHGVDERYAHVLTSHKIAELRGMLHLLPDQRLLWPPVEAVLHEIGRGQLAQIRRGQHPEVEQAMMMRLYWAAQPLLASLQPAQKERVRALARSLGYASVASML